MLVERIFSTGEFSRSKLGRLFHIINGKRLLMSSEAIHFHSFFTHLRPGLLDTAKV